MNIRSLVLLAKKDFISAVEGQWNSKLECICVTLEFWANPLGK